MRRYLIFSAGMGGGHLDVAREVARRLTDGGDAAMVVDLLRVLPWRIGGLLRSGYSAMLRRAPWMYDAIYRGFFVSRAARMNIDPFVTAILPAIARLIADAAPDAVVSVFHLAAQIVGRLRTEGVLTVPAVVVLTDFVAHRLWLHPGNDLYLCVHPSVAEEVERSLGVPVGAPGPVVPREFLDRSSDGGRLGCQDEADRSGWWAATDDNDVRDLFGVAGERPLVLISSGAWGSGELLVTAEAICDTEFHPVVLCGRNDELREVLRRRFGDTATALGWREDLPRLMRAASVLVDNAAGQTAVQALAAGVPVVAYRPIPGHGRDGVRRMQELGLSRYAASASELRSLLVELTRPTSTLRADLVSRGRAIFVADPVRVLSDAVSRLSIAAA